MKFIILGIYVIVVTGLFAYLAIVLVHLKGFMQYSKYLKPVTRLYIVFLLSITLFGVYHILKGDATPKPNFNSIKQSY